MKNTPFQGALPHAETEVKAHCRDGVTSRIANPLFYSMLCVWYLKMARAVIEPYTVELKSDLVEDETIQQWLQ